MSKLEFRIPISPTRSFFHQVRFFESAFRRLGPAYEAAKVLVVVGDNASHDEVLAENRWSEGRNMEWHCVPTDIFARYGIHGTADYRYIPSTSADLVILSDADTVLARDIDPILAMMDPASAKVAGHMAHVAPPIPDANALGVKTQEELWRRLLGEERARAATWRRYSMDPLNRWGMAPPYFNLGFIALTPPALAIFRDRIWATQDYLLANFPSHMRCQLAVSMIAFSAGVEMVLLDAEYNLANDPRHLACNGVEAIDARVIHYLRSDELVREEMVLPEHLPDVLAKRLANPVNQRLQALLRIYAGNEFGIQAEC